MKHAYMCEWRDGFVMDPSNKGTVGYLVNFTGLNMGEYLKQDITVFTPYNNSETGYGGVAVDAETKKITVAGVIDSFTFGGGVGDPIVITAYISAQNAEIIKAKTKTTLDTTIVKELSWWICAYDTENKAWFEAAYPKDPATIACQLNARGGGKVALEVFDTPIPVAQNIDVNVFQMNFEVVPAANATYALHFATSAKTKFIRNWGLVVGTNAAQAMG